MSKAGVNKLKQRLENLERLTIQLEKKTKEFEKIIELLKEN